MKKFIDKFLDALPGLIILGYVLYVVITAIT
jgi:hypothetical protein